MVRNENPTRHGRRRGRGGRRTRQGPQPGPKPCSPPGNDVFEVDELLGKERPVPKKQNAEKQLEKLTRKALDLEEHIAAGIPAAEALLGEEARILARQMKPSQIRRKMAKQIMEFVREGETVVVEKEKPEIPSRQRQKNLQVLYRRMFELNKLANFEIDCSTQYLSEGIITNNERRRFLETLYPDGSGGKGMLFAQDSGNFDGKSFQVGRRQKGHRRVRGNLPKRHPNEKLDYRSEICEIKRALEAAIQKARVSGVLNLEKCKLTPSDDEIAPVSGNEAMIVHAARKEVWNFLKKHARGQRIRMPSAPWWRKRVQGRYSTLWEKLEIVLRLNWKKHRRKPVRRTKRRRKHWFTKKGDTSFRKRFMAKSKLPRRPKSSRRRAVRRSAGNRVLEQQMLNLSTQ